MKILKIFFGSIGGLLLIAALLASMADSERLNNSTTVLGLSAQVLFLAALVIHLSEKKRKAS